MSPEALKGVVGKAADVWAFGVVVFELLTRHRAYPNVRPIVLMQQIANEGLKPIIPAELKNADTRPPWLPESLILLVESCFEPNPTDRPSFKSICNKIKLL